MGGIDNGLDATRSWWQRSDMMRYTRDDHDGRRTATAALRNTAPLIEAMRNRLPAEGTVLEIASGTGQHAAAFAAAFSDLHWIPSDIDPEQRISIQAWRRFSGLTNLMEPIALDVASHWSVLSGSVAAVLTINLLHLVPEPHVAQLFTQARKVLADQGRVLVYGPFLRGLSYASDGDRSFDASLRARDPSIGYKSVEAVAATAKAAGFVPIATDPMPANNLLLSFAPA